MTKKVAVYVILSFCLCVEDVLLCRPLKQIVRQRVELAKWVFGRGVMK